MTTTPARPGHPRHLTLLALLLALLFVAGAVYKWVD